MVLWKNEPCNGVDEVVNLFWVLTLKTPKSMFDALTKLFEGKNINWKMTLRNQLKNVKIRMQKPSSLNSQEFLKSKNNWKQ